MLSAAHCMDPALYVVRLGENDLRTTRDGLHKDVFVAKYEKHKQFDERLMINDIAMLYLDRDIEFTGNVDFFLTNIIYLSIVLQLILNFFRSYPTYLFAYQYTNTELWICRIQSNSR